MTGFISSQSRRVEAQEHSVGRFGFRGPFLSSQMATISAFPLCAHIPGASSPFVRTPVILNEDANPVPSFNPNHRFIKALSPNVVVPSVLGVTT